MQFWTKEEYQRFAEAIMDKPMSYYAFEMLYWCGIREGELLALTPGDFNFKAGTVSINKSYQRLHGEDVITTPKTKKNIRTIKMPKFLCEEMQEYIQSLYGVKKKNRIFPVTKNYLYHEMDRGCRASGVERIRVHDIRHSLQIKSQAPNGTCCKEIWQKVGRKKCSTNKPPQSAGLKREKRK